MKRRLTIIIAVLAAGLVTAGGIYLWPFISAQFRRACDGRPVARQHQWAQRVTAAGVDNCFRVAPGLYRGAQPTAEGMRSLKALGIRTIVNLRQLHSDRDEIGGEGLAYVHIRCGPFHPEMEDAVAFLKVAADPNRQPVFVHCQRGIDRTGMMCAVYRMAVQGWTHEEAVAEMTRGGFGHDDVFRNVVEWLRSVDVGELRRRAGLGG